MSPANKGAVAGSPRDRISEIGFPQAIDEISATCTLRFGRKDAKRGDGTGERCIVEIRSPIVKNLLPHTLVFGENRKAPAGIYAPDRTYQAKSQRIKRTHHNGHSGTGQETAIGICSLTRARNDTSHSA